MRNPARSPRQMQGVMLIEALLAILIFSIGVLAIVGMQAVAIKTVTDAKYRSQAAFLANELLAQIWNDASNPAAAPNIPVNYSYAGGTPPASLTTWVADVSSKLPGISPAVNPTTNAPTVTISSATTQGATVQIVVQWQTPEEASQGLPPHNHTVLASVYGNP